MYASPNALEIIWDGFLSRDPNQIRTAFSNLNPDSQTVVIAHLQCIVKEDSWQTEQVLSAQATLDALEASQK